MPSITHQLAEHLGPLLPEEWDLFAVEATLDVLSRPAVLLSYSRSSVVRFGSSALGKQYEIQMTYVSPITHDLEAVDDDLWEAEQIAEEALQQLPFVELTESQRGTYGTTSDGTPSNWAHVFTLQIGIPYSPDPEPDVEPDPTPEEE